MFGHPGKKLLFMGAEIGQWQEWNHDTSLQWHLLESGPHQGVQRLIRDLNALYTAETALWEIDFTQEGFEWIDAGDWEGSIISFVRKDRSGGMILVVCNFTPVVRHHYRVGVPKGGFWKEVLNTDAPEYGGTGQGNPPGVTAEHIACLGREFSLSLTIPPLAVTFLKHTPEVEEKS
jgi:1,4-alpha-glucan branching enzyme